MMTKINPVLGVMLGWIVLGIYYAYLIWFVPKYVELYETSGLMLSHPARFLINYANPILFFLLFFNIFLLFWVKKSPVFIRIGVFGEIILLIVFLFSLWMPFI